MATNVGTIELIARIKTSDYKRDKDEIVKSNKDIEDSSEKSTSNASAAFAKLGKAIGAVSLVAGAAIAGFAAASIKSFASLEQSLGGSEVVFGEFGDEVQKIARESSRVMGTSMNQYLETANKMGSLFQGAGFDVKKSMDLTTAAMQRATDVATAMGISTDMALESIAGAAKGNFTMMDNLGVAMNDTTLEAFRLEKGLKKSVSTMTNAERVGLAMQLFMERTAKFAGNYAKENDTLAGSFQTLRGSWGNFLAGVEGSDTMLIDAIKNVGKVLGEQIPVIAQQMGNLVGSVVREVINQTGIQPYLDIIGENARKAMDVMMMAFEIVRPSLEALGNTIKESVWPSLERLFDTFMRIWRAINPAFVTLMGIVLVGAFNLFINSLNIAFKVSGFFIQVITNMIGWIGNLIGWIGTAAAFIIDNFSNIMNWLKDNWNLVVGFIVGPIGLAISTIIKYFDQIRDIAGKVIGWFADIGSAIGNALGNAFKSAVNAILGFLEDRINNIVDIINGAIGLIDSITPGGIDRVGRVALPRLAEGGIVTRPTIAQIGEGGESEAIIPLSKLDDIMRGNQTGNSSSITINLSGVFATSPAEQRKVAEQIAERLKEVQAARGLIGGIA